jgi:ATP synthase protein I
MPDDPDPEALRRLGDRIAKAKGVPRQAGAMQGLGQGEAAWRMVIELATGMALGLAIGYGLDALFGTAPVMIVIFALLGFAAGVKTMLGTAKALAAKQDARQAGTGAANGTGQEGRDGD